jgi:hypothetical protein
MTKSIDNYLRMNKHLFYNALTKGSVILFCLTALIIVPACGKSSGPRNNYPEPKAMSLISVEPAGDIYRSENLIVNGNFSIWPDETSAPDGFSVPPDTKVSKIFRIDSRGGDGKYSADQWWRSSDQDTPYDRLFRTTVSGIKANRAYDFSVIALPYYHTTASLSIIALDNNNNEVARWTDLIRVTPANGVEQRHTARITTPHDGSLVIVSHGNDNTQYGEKTRICWLEWELVLLGSDLSNTALSPDKQ